MENIEEIYKNYANLIKNYIFLITRDTDLSEEIMQDTFASAIKQLDKFRGDSEISVWLCSIAKNILYKKAKKNNSIKMISIDELDIADNSMLEDEFISKDNKLKLYEALQNLDADSREVMYLRLTGELSFREIGKILHKSENWARVTFFRGKQKLKEGNFNEIG
jgi:RNA polymerase sigma-70 factor (ECF subfamily)